MQNLFPLPLWYDGREALNEILDDMKVKDEPGDWRKRGDTKGQASKALRGQGLRAWHGLVVVMLNFMYGDRAVGTRPTPSGQATGPQERALETLWELVRIFVDEKEANGVPRTSMEDWDVAIDSLRVSYTGEVIEKAVPLTLNQVLPGLPSPEHGGLVDILAVLPEELQETVKHPEKLVLSPPQGLPPRPKVHASSAEWNKIAKALYERGLVRPVRKCPEMEGVKLLNGAFGVPKPGKVTPEGDPVLRFIIDLRSTNFFMAQIQGDTGLLTGAASFQRLIIEDQHELLVSGEDLTSAFYLFRLPEAWADYMVIEKEVTLEALGLEGSGMTRLGVCVLPMGWASAVGLMQAAHRQIALRSRALGGAGLSALAEISRAAVFPDLSEMPAWNIYLDDTTVIEQVEKCVVAELEGKPAEEQEQLRKAYAWWGIPLNAEKALKRVREAERLGSLIDGKNGVLRTKAKRSLDLYGLGSWIRSLKKVPRKALQVYAGKAVHILQFRRCLFSVMEVIFVEIARGAEEVVISGALQQEMLLLEAMLPLAQFDLKARVDPVVTCSDACETGGGMCISSRLTRAGQEEAMRLADHGIQTPPSGSQEGKLENQKLLVIDLFAGIGGLSVALQKAGVEPHHVVAVENNPDCRRLLRRKFPGTEFCSDVKKFNEGLLRKAIGRVPGITGILVGGGSPCQGLSKLSSERSHLMDERSALFFEAVRIFDLVEDVAAEKPLWVLKFLENVVADKADISEMSSTLRTRPVLVESADISRVRRPRLYWLSTPVTEAEGVKVTRGDLYDRVHLEAELEPLKIFLGEGVRWPAGDQDDSVRFPTFTRAIPRKKPPPSPAGLSGTDEVAKQRWVEDQFRYPPYTYAEVYMVKQDEILRPLKSLEREVLMGFPRGYTAALSRKIPQGEEQIQAAEDMRCAALGNSFHTNTVASLIDLALFKMGLKPLIGARQIVAAFVRSAQQPAEPEPSVKDDLSDTEQVERGRDDDELTVAGELEMTTIQEGSEQFPTDEELLEKERKLSSKLVAAFVRRQEFRGSDVRLDLGSLFRPDSFPRGSIDPSRWLWHPAQAYAFERSEHINVLELRALIHSFEWRVRSSQFSRCRALHLTASMVALAVVVKGRSSAKVLNRLLRRFAALQLAAGIYPVCGWVESEDNPADEPSRRYA